MNNDTYSGVSKTNVLGSAIKIISACAISFSLALSLASCDLISDWMGNGESNSINESENATKEPTEESTGGEVSEDNTDKEPVSSDDEPTGSESGALTEEPTDKVSDSQTEEITETPTESATEKETDTESEEPTNTVTDTESEEPTDEPSEPNKIHGYTVDLETERALGLEFDNTKEAMVSKGSVWLRSKPSLSTSARAVSIKARQSLELIGVAGEWCRVGYKGKVYYLRSHYLVKDEPQDGPTGIYYEGSGDNKNFVIAIDAGHQNFGMSDTEPNAPGSTVMKAKVTSGTIGTVTNIWEHELNLDVAMRLKKLLLDAGYSVVMIRESGNVTISNAERAQIANQYGVDAFVRIHANSASNTSARGALTMCQSEKNKYNGYMYNDSYSLSKLIIDEFCKETGLGNRGVTKTDTMTGINWCTVPTTIVEMGFMSNAAEDRLMATEAFKQNAAEGIFKGLVRYAESKIIYG